ncbi:hypothetical protein [Nocardioides currus]|uniref:Peptidase C39-like domain-containing protein n=1 Tax=Nocardioides currus TaxID=2133958 RepID=A0A2R7YZS9_9ACTN|nr:hypothetical protein [Nocardioides currus]PUA81870.1 hypothetical protein C7S10_07400 [Nocardioides currus]
MIASETGRLVLGRQFQQPDRRSCGAAVAVMAEALVNDSYARRLLAGGDTEFERETMAMHRRITGPVDAAGAIQAPWLRAVGTPPWALSRQLDRRSHRVRSRRVLVARLRPGRAWAAMTSALADGALVPAYVGSRWLPRHVVLAIELMDDAVRFYEPGTGRVVRVTREEWLEGRLLLGGWRDPWLVVSPRR